MIFNKVAIYGRVGNRNQLLNNPILYAYSKDQYTIDVQLSFLDAYCKENDIKYGKKIYDLGESNFYKNKRNLQNIISSNKNIDIIIKDVSRLGRNGFDTYSLYEKCQEKNIKIFSVIEDRFLSEIFEIEKEEKDMEM